LLLSAHIITHVVVSHHVTTTERSVLLHLWLRSESHLLDSLLLEVSHGSLLLEVSSHGVEVSRHHTALVVEVSTLLEHTQVLTLKHRSPHATAHASEVSLRSHLIETLSSVLEEHFATTHFVLIVELLLLLNFSVEFDVSGFDDLIQSLIHFDDFLSDFNELLIS
jgi:hypothetical protein